jgi:hypothetical protein
MTYEEYLREQIAKHMEACAELAMRSNEYNFNDTALRSKTFLLAADAARGKEIKFL